ncbi:hypothetical protein [Pseudomonas carassii]|uniref:Uncharacterized protein n=1 Tax=Pseudomonas carassii TaxID=3115855 RepID=A0ABU7HEQ7_9PSED|nr:hypothetical protein [Pseudomonas sp. 137P]MEE1889427.1 hypothetical protein [Pseudomonas sp. 137P]
MPLADLFMANVYSGYFVSERVKNWFERHCLEALQLALIPQVSDISVELNGALLNLNQTLGRGTAI